MRDRSRWSARVDDPVDVLNRSPLPSTTRSNQNDSHSPSAAVGLNARLAVPIGACSLAGTSLLGNGGRVAFAALAGFVDETGVDAVTEVAAAVTAVRAAVSALPAELPACRVIRPATRALIFGFADIADLTPAAAVERGFGAEDFRGAEVAAAGNGRDTPGCIAALSNR